MSMSHHDPPRPLEWTPELVEAFWAFRSSRPHEYFSGLYKEQLASVFVRHCKTAARVLDFGCGPGFLGEHLIKKGYRVAFTDLAQESLNDISRRLRQNPSFLGAFQADELLSRDRRFDAVLAIELLEHLPDAELEHIMNSVRAVMQPQALLMVTTPNSENLDAMQTYCPVSNLYFHPWQHVRSWTRTTLSRYLEGQYFDVLAAYTTDFSIPRSQLLRRLRVAQHRRQRPDRLPHLVAIARSK